LKEVNLQVPRKLEELKKEKEKLYEEHSLEVQILQ
jgi:hypothetical protein